MRIIQAATAEQLAQEKELILEYTAWLNFDLSFQGFAEEIDNLLGKYGPPAGRLLLALVGDQPAGCGALHALARETCEMNRVYVRPDFRGKGIGRRLVETLIAEARTIGYHRVRLETGDWMLAALALYRDLGFSRVAPYVSADLGPHVIFMELGLIPQV